MIILRLFNRSKSKWKVIVITSILILASNLIDVHAEKKEYELQKVKNSSDIIFNWRIAKNDIQTDSKIFKIKVSKNGSVGWAVGDDGTILRYSGGKWKYDEVSSSLTIHHLIGLWIDASGQNGWSVGRYGTILKLHGGFWKRDSKASALTKNGISAVWVNQIGSQGWAVGDKGTILRYNNGEWEIDKNVVAPKTLLTNLAMNPKGTAGWAVGDKGTILKFSNGKWEIDDIACSILDDMLMGLWIDSTGTRGWAGGDKGQILKLENGIWSRYCEFGDLCKKFSIFPRVTSGLISNISLNEKGTAGYAVGLEKEIGGDLLEFEDNRWDINLKAGLTTEYLFGLDFNGSNGTGWASGDAGTVLRLGNSEWEVYGGALEITKYDVMDLWVNSNATQGWAVGAAGLILELKNGEWYPHQNTNGLTDDRLLCVEMSENGKAGWTAGVNGALLRFDAGQWIIDATSNAKTKDSIVDIWLSSMGTFGWGVGTNGTILRYEDNKWEIDPHGSKLTDNDLSYVWISSDGLHGWAIGDKGTILRYEDKEWRIDLEGIEATEDFLVALWMNDEGTRGWAAGNNGTFLKYSYGIWKKDLINSTVTEMLVSDIVMNKSGTKGVAVADGGTLLYYSDGFWRKDIVNSTKTQEPFFSVRIDDDFTIGWAVGVNGQILKGQEIDPGAIKLVELRDSKLENLTGSYQIKPSGIAQEIDIENILIVLGETKIPIEAKILKKTPLTFELDSENIASRFKHEKASLQFDLSFSDIRTPYRASYRLKKEDMFKVSGPSALRNIWIVPVLLILSNLLIIFLSIQWAWFRRFMYSSEGLKLLRMVLRKYFLVDALICHVSPIKLAVFRDYRVNYKQSPIIKRWEEADYVPPSLSFEKNNYSKASKSENTYESVFNKILESPKNKMYLILGVSGIGKTALLENWAGLVIERSLTPLYVRLGGNITPEEEIANEIYQYGAINLDAEAVNQYLIGGGFIVLIDGLNETSIPNKVRDFIRRICKNNIVVITSQTETRWEQWLSISPIELKRFGGEQLANLIEPIWVQRILESKFLSEESSLPQTAYMIAKFISDNRKLPTYRLDLYQYYFENLMAKLDIPDLEDQLLNFEETAWNLFRHNEPLFSATNAVPTVLCQIAVDSGVLTISRNKDRKDVLYRFRHEQIHRYFTVRYLDRQARKPLSEWNTAMKPGLSKYLWYSTLDFWAEMHVKRVIEKNVPAGHYFDFLRDAAVFDITVFRNILYPQARKYEEAGLLSLDKPFLKEAGDLMSGIK